VSALHDLTALQQAAAVRDGSVSPVELVEHYLARVGELDDVVGAFVTVTADRARAQARAAERDAVRARAAGEQRSLPPLLGVPTGIKDLHAVAGVPMKCGSLACADLVPVYDDHSTALLREAGTISLGKTNTPEFGLPCYTEPDPGIAPPARTPYDLDRSAGGSSGGAAAAVAAGLVPFAPGSDGGGSIRIPASACGLVGLKTSRGRVSNGPYGTEGAGLLAQGPLARTVADAAAMLDVLAGPQPGDASWAPPLPPGETFLQQLGRPPGRLRIGRYVDNILAAPVATECRAGWEHASALLAELGHDIEDVPAPPFGDLFADFTVLWSVGIAAAPIPADRESLLVPLTRWLRECGAAVPATAYAASLRAVQLAVRDLLAATARYDALLTPTLAQLPAPIGSLRDDADPAADFAAQSRFTPWTSTYNMTGQPAVSLPVHRTAAGLPVGIQLVGRPAGEAGLLRLAAQLEQAVGWSDVHPPCW
jgi:amidase